MGWVYAHNVEAAARHLLSVLADREWIDYSAFYDGSDSTSRNLRLAVGVDPDDDGTSAETFMDIAVDQLKEQGIVTTTRLETKLADEECDYRVAWTDSGREKAKSVLRFRDAEL